MLIKNYGLFWRRDEVRWNPGQGQKGAFRLLGRRGSNLPGFRLADFRDQIGIYILYGNYGPHYVGLTRDQNLGKRLKDHLSDEHGKSWDRFSWFGFRQVLKKKGKQLNRGIDVIKDELPASIPVEPDRMIGDIEALLIKAMGLRNKAHMEFDVAEEWLQVKLDETEQYLAKARKTKARRSPA
jgi:hypothetical protein